MRSLSLSFIQRWKLSGGSERANFQSFARELCDVLDSPKPDPATDQTARNDYTFERTVSFDDGFGKVSTGFIDLYRRDCFVMEAKQGSDEPEPSPFDLSSQTASRRKLMAARRGTPAWQQAMRRAFNPAVRYARCLPNDHGWPPFIMVVDVGYCIDLFADFSRQGKNYLPFPDPASYRILIDDLRQESLRERVRLAWTEPLALDRSQETARATRELAGRLAKLASSLEDEGHAPEDVAHFLMRCLFTMFAEDVGLLPDRTAQRRLCALLVAQGRRVGKVAGG